MQHQPRVIRINRNLSEVHFTILLTSSKILVLSGLTDEEKMNYVSEKHPFWSEKVELPEGDGIPPKGIVQNPLNPGGEIENEPVSSNHVVISGVRTRLSPLVFLHDRRHSLPTYTGDGNIQPNR